MKILHWVYPTWNLLWLFICILNWLNIHWSCSNNIPLLNVSQFNDSLIFVIESWLIKYCYTQVFFRVIWLWHLQERINFAYTWNIVWNEGLKLGVQVYFLRFVTLNIFEEIFHFTWHLQICIVCWIVSTWYGFFLIIVIILLLLSLLWKCTWLLPSFALYLWLLLLLLRSSNIDFISIFIWINFLTVIYLNSQIKWLILYCLTLYFCTLLSGRWTFLLCLWMRLRFDLSLLLLRSLLRLWLR